MNTLLRWSSAAVVLTLATVALAQSSGEQTPPAQEYPAQSIMFGVLTRFEMMRDSTGDVSPTSAGTAAESTSGQNQPVGGQFFIEGPPPGHLNSPPRRDAVRASIKQRYPDLAEAVDIDAATAEKLLDLLTEHQLRMQSIALEFNYSETTFVLPPKDASHTARVRIFTPRAEIPFAGHPNVGTAFVIANSDARTASSMTMIFEEAAGLIPVDLITEDGEVVGAELTAPEPLTKRSEVPAEALAACLGIEAADIRVDHHEPAIISIGLPFLVAELFSRSALRRAKPNLAAFDKVLPLDGADAVYVYTRDVAPDEKLYDIAARMFAPFDGIVEDPATGSATAAVSALLATQSPESDCDLLMRFIQGADLGRPSTLNTQVLRRNGQVTTVRVGGRCVKVMEGWLDVMD